MLKIVWSACQPTLIRSRLKPALHFNTYGTAPSYYADRRLRKSGVFLDAESGAILKTDSVLSFTVPCMGGELPRIPKRALLSAIRNTQLFGLRLTATAALGVRGTLGGVVGHLEEIVTGRSLRSSSARSVYLLPSLSTHEVLFRTIPQRSHARAELANERPERLHRRLLRTA